MVGLACTAASTCVELSEASGGSASIAEDSGASWLFVARGCVQPRANFLALPMRPPRTDPPRVEGGRSGGAAVVLLRVVVRLVRFERVAVGRDCGGDAGTPDSCSWRVTCLRVLAMVSKSNLEGNPVDGGVS